MIFGGHMSGRGTFKDIQFGFSSAEAERAEDPGLLLEGYLQLNNSFESARIGPKFLFLGYKGSGKSAIGEKTQSFI
jgi:hypothetical protein